MTLVLCSVPSVEDVLELIVVFGKAPSEFMQVVEADGKNDSRSVMVFKKIENFQKFQFATHPTVINPCHSRSRRDACTLPRYYLSV